MKRQKKTIMSGIQGVASFEPRRDVVSCVFVYLLNEDNTLSISRFNQPQSFKVSTEPIREKYECYETIFRAMITAFLLLITGCWNWSNGFESPVVSLASIAYWTR
jgi:hypothetical protein